MKNRSFKSLYPWLFVVVFVLACFLNIFLGAVFISDLSWDLFVNVRLPRVVVAIFVGACLAGAGVFSQGLFRNSLASPSVIGSLSGASLGGVIAFSFGFANMSWASVPIAAVLGCLLATMLILFFAKYFSWDIYYLIFLGVAFNAIFGALSAMLISKAMGRHDLAASTYFWLMGGLNARGFEHLYFVLPAFFVAILLAPKLGAQLDVIAFGYDWAESLGINAARTQFVIILCVSLLVGSAVAVAGGVSFVGLIVPHLTRLAIGARHTKLFYFSLLNGASLVLIADLLCRTLFAPEEIQLGVATAFMGGLFFVFILWHHRKQQRVHV